VLEAEPAADVAEGEESVARAVVGHDPLYLDAEGRVVGDDGLVAHAAQDAVLSVKLLVSSIITC
jgi:hypothetical protein